MTLLIRPIRPDEEPRFLARVVETTWLDLPAAERRQLSAQAIAPGVARVVALLMDQGDNVILVADLGCERNVGQAWLGVAPDPYSGQARGYLYNLYVDATARGRGVGRALAEAALAASRARGDATLALTVAAHNPAAQALYHSLGLHEERIVMSIAWGEQG